MSSSDTRPMATPDNPPQSSVLTSAAAHKRTISTAEITQQQPPVKRQAQDNSQKPRTQPQPQPPPQYVYVVTVNIFDRDGEAFPTTWGVYATVQDANNTVKSIANDEFPGVRTDEHARDVDEDGLVSWSADNGNGESTWVHTQKMKVEAPGSVPECEWAEPEDDEEEAE
ncbi:hypothetical protein BDZ45DRAFT_671080 [Acephala macrosclerotiorum]|nr:hypothetical protein BDZ45DRAFT_671080 [Acephala macrosclerotiorum]